MPIHDPIRDLVFIGTYGVIAFILTFLLAPLFIKFLYRHRVGKQIRDVAIDGKAAPLFHKLHAKKSGTPTMGGVLIWGVTFLTVGLSRLLSFFGVIDRSLLQRTETYLPLATLLATAILGAIDDFFNILGKGSGKGINVKPQFFWLTLFAGAGAWWFYFKLEYNTIHIIGLGDFLIGMWYIPLFMLVIIATAKAVDITDGLDGLAGGLLMLAYGAFGIIAYAKGMVFLTALCAVIAGSLAAFLWFNVSPAKFFMGNTGAAALGATLGVIAMLTDSLLVLFIVGGVFVMETLSDIIQIFSKRVFKRKVFQIAPLHHHLEAIGWPEHTIVFRFWIIGGLLAVIGVIIGLLGMGTLPAQMLLP
jgi:phospho-N-acetylmuramoyl-pentapeptide-transferase